MINAIGYYYLLISQKKLDNEFECRFKVHLTEMV